MFYERIGRSVFDNSWRPKNDQKSTFIEFLSEIFQIVARKFSKTALKMPFFKSFGLLEGLDNVVQVAFQNQNVRFKAPFWPIAPLQHLWLCSMRKRFDCARSFLKKAIKIILVSENSLKWMIENVSESFSKMMKIKGSYSSEMFSE